MSCDVSLLLSLSAAAVCVVCACADSVACAAQWHGATPYQHCRNAIRRHHLEDLGIRLAEDSEDGKARQGLLVIGSREFVLGLFPAEDKTIFPAHVLEHPRQHLVLLQTN